MFQEIIAKLNEDILNNKIIPQTVRERRQYLMELINTVYKENYVECLCNLAMMTDREVLGLGVK